MNALLGCLRAAPPSTLSKAFAISLAITAKPVAAATNDGLADWLPWLVLGAIGLFVAGVALRMFIAARFPKGYGAWARSRRDSFAERNAQWDRGDEERR